MTKAYAYLRVSGKSQVDGDGFARQEEEVRRYAQKAGLEIVEVFREEGISGTADENERPSFQAMLEQILANGVRTIVIERMDRLAREYRVQEALMIYLAARGVSLHSAATEEDVTEAIQADPMKKALVQMQGIFAELEKNLLVRKLRKARERKKALTGKCGGRKSFKELNPEAHAVLFQLRAEGFSLLKIADEMNKRGFKPVIGERFNVKSVSYLLNSERRQNEQPVDVGAGQH